MVLPDAMGRKLAKSGELKGNDLGTGQIQLSFSWISVFFILFKLELLLRETFVGITFYLFPLWTKSDPGTHTPLIQTVEAAESISPT